MMGVLDQGVVSVPILFFAEELGDHDHVIVLHRSCIPMGGRNLGISLSEARFIGSTRFRAWV